MTNVANASDSEPSSAIITADNTFAAIDLGSNSFHMAVASTTDSHMQMIDKLRQPVRLGAGLDSNNNITTAVSYTHLTLPTICSV